MYSKILKKKPAAYIGAIICTALWGTAFPFIKMGYESLAIPGNDAGSKLLFAGQRFSIAGIVVFLMSLLIYRREGVPKKKDIAPILVLGLVQTTFQYLFSYIGVGFTTATNTSVITGTTSLISVLMASMFFKSDKLTLPKIFGCVIGFCGIFVVNAGSIDFASVTMLGDFLILGSAFCGAGGNVITKKIAGKRNPVTLTGLQLFSGGLLLIFAGVFLGGKTNYTSLKSVGILCWLSFVSAVAFLLWTVLLRYHPVSRISVFNMLVPVFGTLWSGILLKEDILKWQNLLSLVLISVGIIMVNIRLSQEKKK